MSCYPTFVFFTEMPAAARLARRMIDAFGARLPEFAVAVPVQDGEQLEEDRDRALMALSDPRLLQPRFWLASPLHSIEFWRMPTLLWAIRFGDFDSELYDQGLTEELQQDKRQLALDLHGALLREGARWSYTESGEDKAALFGGSEARAERIARAIGQTDGEAVARELRQTNPWLIGAHQEVARWPALGKLLDEEFILQPGCGEGRGAVFEHRRERPLFLPRVRGR